ncbi:glycosyltransferase [Microbulbifer sp. OS29]|uniref:Glycosyltransferase n=1 Tax=Microbulbifer okhotskensis TaxID=2926617 RepID=A0A9X2EJT6_9GAMM|nr:glycosyltransferase [Microbulbifer okhotskensis]MCO1333542.1 glycosyltransferase [Microbulbifer okhotskensis]
MIIPVYQQWHYIDELLRYLELQEVSRGLFELILISNDGELPLTLRECSYRIKVEQCEKPGSYAARNRGAQLAGGEWLVFTDADCLPDPKWIAEIEKGLSNSVGKGEVFAGNIRMLKQCEFSSIYEVYDFVKGIPQEVYVSAGVAATANLIVEKSLFINSGGFDERSYSCGDFELCKRLRELGCRLLFLRLAFVCHRVRSTWPAVSTKARRIKGGQFLTSGGGGRLRVVIFTLLPPIRSILYFLRMRNVSIKHRVLAILVQLRLWGVEITELIRLIVGANPERR